MKKQNIKYVMLFLASLSMASIQATPQSWLEYLASFMCSDFGRKSEEQRRIEAEARLKQEKMDAYRQEALGLKDAIFKRYQQGALSNGTPLAKVDDIAVDVVDPNMPEPTLNYDEPDDKKWEEAFKNYMKNLDLWRQAQTLKSANGKVVLGITVRSKEDNDLKPIIYLNADNTDIPQRYRSETTLHELAHALDGCLRKEKGQRSDCYAWLHGDVKQYGNHPEIELEEWHADKQAAYWLKTYWPEDAKFMKGFYKYLLSNYGEKENLEYAPYRKKVEWLSTYNPLRMKEIKRFGLLWNM
jgi:hypothetical protein